VQNPDPWRTGSNTLEPKDPLRAPNLDFIQFPGTIKTMTTSESRDDLAPAIQRGGPVEQLRRAGLRVTAVRVTALDVVAAMPHLEVDALWREVGRRLGSVSKQAVYDALEVLAAADLVRRIQPAGSPARYETRAGDNHHHVVCRACGAAADVDCAVGAAPCLEPSDTHGYAIDEAEVIFWGLCPSCAAAPRQDNDQVGDWLGSNDRLVGDDRRVADDRLVGEP
jgi:Fur family ferric uptake transcriptional regulator